MRERSAPKRNSLWLISSPTRPNVFSSAHALNSTLQGLVTPSPPPSRPTTHFPAFLSFTSRLLLAAAATAVATAYNAEKERFPTSTVLKPRSAFFQSKQLNILLSLSQSQVQSSSQIRHQQLLSPSCCSKLKKKVVFKSLAQPNRLSKISKVRIGVTVENREG